MPNKIVPALSFDVLTPFYDALCTLVGYGMGFRRKILKAAAITDGECILDIGCGTGTLTLLVQQQYLASLVMGFDPDLRALTIGKSKIVRAQSEVTLLQANAARIPLASSCVDVALSSLIFHHLPAAVKQQALQEIHRVLKPSGRFLLADFGRAEGFWMKSIDTLIRLLRLPEAATMQDNVEGRIPTFLAEAGFVTQEVVPPYRGIRFYLANKGDLEMVNAIT